MLKAFCLCRCQNTVAGIWAGDASRAYLVLFCMPVAAALHLVLPLQHDPVLLEVLAKDLEGLLEQFQKGTDLVISSSLILCPRDLFLSGLAGQLLLLSQPN